jgi:acyl-coenzyme A synthetase/AMP-(fatty) acid ligase
VSNPLEPVHLGRLRGPELGVAVQAWDDSGARVIGEVGEMVITRPLPSMPLALWNDPDGAETPEGEFYAALEHVPEVLDALVVGAEEPDGGYYMPLFVVPTTAIAKGALTNPDTIDFYIKQARRRLNTRAGGPPNQGRDRRPPSTTAPGDTRPAP